MGKKKFVESRQEETEQTGSVQSHRAAGRRDSGQGRYKGLLTGIPKKGANPITPASGFPFRNWHRPDDQEVFYFPFWRKG